MKCFYHNDADGHCAGYWVYDQVGLGELNREFIAINYNDTFPMGSIEKNETVWIVDFSISPEEMEELLSITPNVTWVDHHASAIEKYGDDFQSVPGVRYDGIAGCELTWAYIMRMTDDCGESGRITESFYPDMCLGAPMFTRLIGDRDVWKFAFGDKSRFIQEAFIVAGKPAPESAWWNEFHLGSAILEDRLAEGEICRKYSKMLKKVTLQGWGHEVIFEGYRVPAVNSTIRTSELFGELLKDVPFGIIYTHDGAKWVIGLYSDNDGMPVRQLAMKHGGGGHDHACGFETHRLPFAPAPDLSDEA